jgi:hypothetical protein
VVEGAEEGGGSIQSSSGLEGEIILQTISPLERRGVPNSRPFQAEVTILDARGQSVDRFERDRDGRFRVALAPGTYTLHPESPRTLPRASDQPVSVAPGQFTKVRIVYDSGIR